MTRKHDVAVCAMRNFDLIWCFSISPPSWKRDQNNLFAWCCFSLQKNVVTYTEDVFICNNNNKFYFKKTGSPIIFSGCKTIHSPLIKIIKVLEIFYDPNLIWTSSKWKWWKYSLSPMCQSFSICDISSYSYKILTEFSERSLENSYITCPFVQYL